LSRLTMRLLIALALPALALPALAAAALCDPDQWKTGKAYAQSEATTTTTAEAAGDCCALCAASAKCGAWNWKGNGNCFLFAVPTKLNDNPTQNSTYGSKPAPPPTPPLPRPIPVPAPPGSLNVLMIAIDDMRPELEPYGAAHMHTPRMAELAQRSMLFSRAYVQVAVCMPSRNALLFGRRPDTAQAWRISPTQFPRHCGGARCPGNVCGPQCGIIEGANATDPATAIPGVSLPGWFYKNGCGGCSCCCCCCRWWRWCCCCWSLL